MTDLSPMPQANPMRGAKLFLSVRTSPRPMPSPDCPAVTVGRVAGILGSRYERVPVEGTINLPVLLLKVGSKFSKMSCLSTQGETSSYRIPRFTVRLDLTFQSSWKKYPCSQLVT